MLLEDQYGVGDVIDVGPATGTVEAVTLRVTKIRDADGTLWYVPNGDDAARRQQDAGLGDGRRRDRRRLLRRPGPGACAALGGGGPGRRRPDLGAHILGRADDHGHRAAQRRGGDAPAQGQDVAGAAVGGRARATDRDAPGPRAGGTCRSPGQRDARWPRTGPASPSRPSEAHPDHDTPLDDDGRGAGRPRRSQRARAHDGPGRASAQAQSSSGSPAWTAAPSGTSTVSAAGSACSATTGQIGRQPAGSTSSGDQVTSGPRPARSARRRRAA